MKIIKLLLSFLVLFIFTLFVSPGIASGKSPSSDSTSESSKGMQQIQGSVDSPKSTVEKVTVLRETGGRVAWSPNGEIILIDQKGTDGFYDLYLVRPGGTGEVCLTCDTGGVLANGHHGTAEWHPSGDYIVFQSQKKATTRNWGKNIAAQPGFGRYMDLWLMDLKTRQFHQLTHTADTDDTGVLHPHFSDDGKQLTWSEMYHKPISFKKAAQAGYWRIKLVDFSFKNRVPELTNERVFEPGGPGFYENHGLSPDKTKLLFTANFDSKKASDFLTTTSIYLYDLTTYELKKISREKYNEHAHYYPNKNRILWMTSMENPTRGTDYWSMNPDGTDKKRITDFNNPNLPTYKRQLVIAADSSFNPDGKKLVAYLQLNLLTQEGPIVILEFDSEVSNPDKAPANEVPESEPQSPPVTDSPQEQGDTVSVDAKTGPGQLLYLANNAMCPKAKTNQLIWCPERSGVVVLTEPTKVTHTFSSENLGTIQEHICRGCPAREWIMLDARLRNASGKQIHRASFPCYNNQVCKKTDSKTFILPAGTYYLENSSFTSKYLPLDSIRKGHVYTESSLTMADENARVDFHVQGVMLPRMQQLKQFQQQQNQ